MASNDLDAHVFISAEERNGGSLHWRHGGEVEGVGEHTNDIVSQRRMQCAPRASRSGSLLLSLHLVHCRSLLPATSVPGSSNGLLLNGRGQPHKSKPTCVANMPEYTLEELAKHNTTTDLWIAIVRPTLPLQIP